MRFVRLASAAVLLSLASLTAAYAEDSDRVGDLLRTVKKARLIDLSSSWENDSPVAGVNPPYHFRLRDTHASSRGFFRSEEHTSELQSHHDLVCRLLLEKKKNKKY